MRLSRCVGRASLWRLGGRGGEIRHKCRVFNVVYPPAPLSGVPVACRVSCPPVPCSPGRVPCWPAPAPRCLPGRAWSCGLVVPGRVPRPAPGTWHLAPGTCPRLVPAAARLVPAHPPPAVRLVPHPDPPAGPAPPLPRPLGLPSPARAARRHSCGGSALPGGAPNPPPEWRRVFGPDGGGRRTYVLYSLGYCGAHPLPLPSYYNILQGDLTCLTCRRCCTTITVA